MRPDVVHFHDAEMLAVLPLARLWWPKAKFVYDVHENFAELMMIRDWLPDPLKPIARALTAGCERSLSRLAHGIVAVTPPLAASFPHSKKTSAMNFPTADFFESALVASRPAKSRRFGIVHLELSTADGLRSLSTFSRGSGSHWRTCSVSSSAHLRRSSGSCATGFRPAANCEE